MPLYTYRREDGTTFDFRQSFSDEPLALDPQTGQSVVRVVQAPPIIFKGSGFYVNDSRSKSNSTIKSQAKTESSTTSGSAETSSTASATTSQPSSAAAD